LTAPIESESENDDEDSEKMGGAMIMKWILKALNKNLILMAYLFARDLLLRKKMMRHISAQKQVCHLMNENVKRAWSKETNGVRRPITLAAIEGQVLPGQNIDETDNEKE